MKICLETKTVTLDIEDVKQLFQKYFHACHQIKEFEIRMEQLEQPKEELWYPDDSGEWVEVTDVEGMKKFKDGDIVAWLRRVERDKRKLLGKMIISFEGIQEHISEIVAIKKAR